MELSPTDADSLLQGFVGLLIGLLVALVFGRMTTLN
jgi:hypothetical protein